jgi:HlyD family secretion protein
MPDSNPIFRQSALDRLSSPEQLDQMMQVTTPKSWLALGACCVLVLTALAWGIFGKIHEKVHGRGILIKQSGVFLITARSEAIVREIRVVPGKEVKNGQLLLKLEMPEVLVKMTQEQDAQSNLVWEIQKLQQFQTAESNNEAVDRNNQRETYELIKSNFQEQINTLTNRLALLNATNLAGIISTPMLIGISNDFFTAEGEKGKTAVQLGQLKLSEIQSAERRRLQLSEKEFQWLTGKFELEYLSNTYRLNTEVRSQIEGEVLEITVKSNQLVHPNDPIISLQATEEKLHAVLFLPPADGKRVEKSNLVTLEPVTVKKELYGFMSGTVEDVSSFPVTPHLLQRDLENPALVSEFSQGGAPIRILVDLDLVDTNDPSSFKWSSNHRPKTKITSGTLCEGSITLKTNRPISFILPRLREE